MYSNTYELFVGWKYNQYPRKQNIYNKNIILGAEKIISSGCLVNYEYVYCPGGTKVYGTVGKFATGQSKKMFMEYRWICGCLEGIHVYVMGVSNIQGKCNTCGCNKKIWHVYWKRRSNGYRTTINGYKSPIINGSSRGKIESCYVDINSVYTNGRMNGYQIVSH
jgi:hypothetical protein